MEKLKVGDRLYLKSHERCGNNVNYSFATVERLTKTRAILSDGTQLINEPKKKRNREVVEYEVYGDSYTGWSFETPEILDKAKKEAERQKIASWFDNQKFSDEQKAVIYNALTK